MYENDILDLDSIEDLETSSPIKSNRAIKKANKRQAETTKLPAQGSKSTISTKPVESTCNKCHNKIIGELVSDIYMPHINKVIPLITYSCSNCGHEGRRSVYALALPLDQYERKYFN